MRGEKGLSKGKVFKEIIVVWLEMLLKGNHLYTLICKSLIVYQVCDLILCIEILKNGENGVGLLLVV